jgi:hypothetical protein
MEGYMRSKLFRIVFEVVLVMLLALMAAFPVFASSGRDTSPGVTFTPTPDALALIVGVVLTLAFSYFPGLNTWFAAKEPTFKRLFMLIILALTALAIFGLSCASVVTGVTCDKPGVLQMITIFILAVIANQSAYSISPQTPGVMAAKVMAPLAPVNPEIPDSKQP